MTSCVWVPSVLTHPETGGKAKNMSIKFEPALYANALATVIGVAIAFGAHLTDMQVAAILAAFNACAAIFVRSQTVTKPYLQETLDTASTDAEVTTAIEKAVDPSYVPSGESGT